MVIFSWLSKLFRLHVRGLFLYISSFQRRQLEPNRHESDPNLLRALRRRSVRYKLVHSLALSCFYVAMTNRRNPLVSPFSRWPLVEERRVAATL